MAPSERPQRARSRSLAALAAAAACVLLSGVPGGSAYQGGPPAGSGHFRFAAIHWERRAGAAPGMHAVDFVIRSSWRASYAPFWPNNIYNHANGRGELLDKDSPPEKRQVPLLGAKTPAFTVVGETANVTYLPLSLNITEQNVYAYDQHGDWVEGTTVVSHTFSSLGPHRAIFSGCCRVNLGGGDDDFEMEVSVDLASTDFSPAVPAVPGAVLWPGVGASLPAMHPHGDLEPSVVIDGTRSHANLRYKWTVVRTVDLTSGVVSTALPAGVTLTEESGLLQAGAGAAAGMYQVEVDVGLVGTHTASAVTQLLYVQATAPTLMPTLTPASLGSSYFSGNLAGKTLDRSIEFRTGFKVEVHADVAASSSSGSALAAHIVGFMPPGMESHVSSSSAGGSGTRVVVSWDKPCWHKDEAMEVILCMVVHETPTNVSVPAYLRTSRPMCLQLLVREDEAPAFTSPDADATFHWQMGQPASFIVRVEDAARLDTVSKLVLADATPAPAAMALTKATVTGNVAELHVSWEPLPSSGGGSYTLCFQAADTAGVKYEHCRLGTRESERCVTIDVARCRYIVRARESLNDVAAHFHTDWVQLWSLNPELRRPDVEVGFNANSSALGATIKTGHFYKVDRGDYLSAVAYKFGTSVKMLLHLNADLAGMQTSPDAEGAVLPVGKRLCIIPNSCLRD